MSTTMTKPTKPTGSPRVRVRPGVNFAWRPEGRILELRGRYAGCAQYGPVHEFRLAYEVLIEYPDGTAKWHLGPAHPDAPYRKGDVAVLV